MREKIKRFSNITESVKMRSWLPIVNHFTDLKTAQEAIENIEKYVINSTLVSNKEYEAMKVYIRKSDSIWKQNFNDHFVKYKYENGQIIRKEQ